MLGQVMEGDLRKRVGKPELKIVNIRFGSEVQSLATLVPRRIDLSWCRECELVT
jgi:hypothetical protein